MAQLNQVLEHEDELLGALDGKRRNNHAASSFSCVGDEAGEFRQRVFFGMHAVSISRFHDHDIGAFALHGSGMHDLARSRSLIANAANVPGKEHLTALTIYLQRDFRHA